MNSWIRNIQNLLLPPCCALCGAVGQHARDLCDDCEKSLPINSLSCSRCALPLSEGNAGICGQCLQRPPPYHRCIAPWRYESPLDYAVQRLKFHKDLVFARLMGELLAEQLVKKYTDTASQPEAIIPVALHPHRLRERGFNQSVEIARFVAQALHLPLDLRSSSRPKFTQPQANLPATQRKQNIKGAFAFHPIAPYRHIALLDDVMTTGHTINELCKTIQKVCNTTIDVWICARADR